MSSWLTLVGGLTVTVLCIKLSTFVRSRFTQSELPRYIRPGTYALVTGSTDGIGKNIAKELARRGSNVILHGRNPSKLDAVREEVESYGVEVVIWCQEASSHPDVSSLKKLPISILVNNAAQGGTIGMFDDFTAKNIEDVIYSNSTFPTLLTHYLLPSLSKPALVLNVGSLGGTVATPLMTVYSGSKAYLHLWSRGMHAELGSQSDVVVQAVLLGGVRSNNNKLPISLSTPSSEDFAKRLCASVSRARVITPYLFHAIAGYFITLLPSWLADTIVKKSVQDVVKASNNR